MDYIRHIGGYGATIERPDGNVLIRFANVTNTLRTGNYRNGEYVVRCTTRRVIDIDSRCARYNPEGSAQTRANLGFAAANSRSQPFLCR